MKKRRIKNAILNCSKVENIILNIDEAPLNNIFSSLIINFTYNGPMSRASDLLRDMRTDYPRANGNLRSR
jgi:hypothetical protein